MYIFLEILGTIAFLLLILLGLILIIGLIFIICGRK